MRCVGLLTVVLALLSSLAGCSRDSPAVTREAAVIRVSTPTPGPERTFDPAWARVPVVLSREGLSPDMQLFRAPALVRAGQPFTVTVINYGSSSCARIDGADVALDGLLATISPYLRVAARDQPCTGDMHPHAQEIQLTFAAPGAATIVVRGAGHDGAALTLTHELTVTDR